MEIIRLLRDHMEPAPRKDSMIEARHAALLKASGMSWLELEREMSEWAGDKSFDSAKYRRNYTLLAEFFENARYFAERSISCLIGRVDAGATWEQLAEEGIDEELIQAAKRYHACKR